MFRPEDEGLTFLDPVLGWSAVLRCFPNGSGWVRDCDGTIWLFDRDHTATGFGLIDCRDERGES